MLITIFKSFKEGLCKQAPQKKLIQQEQELRETLSEKEIDKMVSDSFPASDPPSNY